MCRSAVPVARRLPLTPQGCLTASSIGMLVPIALAVTGVHVTSSTNNSYSKMGTYSAVLNAKHPLLTVPIRHSRGTCIHSNMRHAHPQQPFTCICSNVFNVFVRHVCSVLNRSHTFIAAIWNQLIE